MMKKFIPLCSLLLAVVLPLRQGWAGEETAQYKPLELRGFGTLGAVVLDAPGGVLYRRDISQATGGARAGQVSFRQNSMLAVQATAHLDKHFSASLQVMSRLDANDSFAPQVAMAYIKYRADETLVRAGRLPVETYMKGDAAEIGYANLLVRQPIVFYPRLFEGVDAETTRSLGRGLLRIKGVAGKAVGKLASADSSVYDTGGSPGAGAALEYAQSGWTGRVSLYALQLKNELQSLQAGGQLATALAGVPNGAQLFKAFSMQDRRLIYRMLALSYDEGALQGGAGWGEIHSHDWGATRSLYAFAGYRSGQFTPYLSCAVLRTPRNFVGSGIPDGLSLPTDALNRGLAAGQADFKINETNLGAGVRYDFARNLALKLQYEHLRYQDSQNIADTGQQAVAAQTREYRSLNLLSVALDFVF